MDSRYAHARVIPHTFAHLIRLYHTRYVCGGIACCPTALRTSFVAGRGRDTVDVYAVDYPIVCCVTAFPPIFSPRRTALFYPGQLDVLPRSFALYSLPIAYLPSDYTHC